MRWGRSLCISYCLLTLTATPALGEKPEWSGRVGLEPRIFFEDPVFDEQPGRGVLPSVVFVPELRNEWNDGNDRFTVVGFFRYDQDDENRSHVDVREANWQHFQGPWSLLAGVGKVFWGVTESRHLVDIINQTDLVEDVDEEQKLGQPMLQLEHWSESGTIAVFVMPGFRERTFPAADARLRGPFPVDEDNAVYESGAEDNRTDIAVRWSNSVGDWDIGLAGFYGTGREPRLVPEFRNEEGIVLVPHYDVIEQFSIDAQYTREAWLWKLETLARSGHGDDFVALVGGLEYTIYGISDGPADFGLLAEYLYDDRDKTAPPTVLEDDVFLGFRYTLNDADDTNILAGAIFDIQTGESISIVEAQRRIGERLTLEAELRWFENISEHGLLLGYENDSYLTLRVSWYF
jgi:hypothetical protein